MPVVIFSGIPRFWKKLLFSDSLLGGTFHNFCEDITMEKTPQKKTILVIEDDPDVLSTVIKQLDYFGYEVIAASDGMDGMKKVDAGGFDLVITDIVMPYISGVGVVTALKEKMPHIPVIAMTGYGKEPESAAMEQKADIVLAKPIKMAALKDHIDTLLAAKEDQ